MPSINAISLAPDVTEWLTNSRHARILHVFDQACNLINERGQVLSVVTPQIGNGPFNLVVEHDVLFSDHLHVKSPISIHVNQLNLGYLNINTINTRLWSPCPDWERLHARRDDILNQILSLRASNSDRSNSYHREEITSSVFGSALLRSDLSAMTGITSYQFSHSLLSSLVNADLPFSLIATQRLAGLGIGLTPAGDDFILGAVLAAWIIHPPEIASSLAKEITNTAAPLTTSLSAAWLRSSGKGEAGILWHHFFEALAAHDPMHVQEALDKINAVGETSGADALAGFIGVILSWMEYKQKELTLHEDSSG